ncbi:hypothetical protein Hanom_Chr07g00651881 [Helianthus anomalus]
MFYVLASEARRKHKTRGNTTSAGLFGSQAAKTIRTIDTMINFYFANFPLHKELSTGNLYKKKWQFGPFSYGWVDLGYMCNF